MKPWKIGREDFVQWLSSRTQVVSIFFLFAVSRLLQVVGRSPSCSVYGWKKLKDTRNIVLSRGKTKNDDNVRTSLVQLGRMQYYNDNETLNNYHALLSSSMHRDEAIHRRFLYSLSLVHKLHCLREDKMSIRRPKKRETSKIISWFIRLRKCLNYLRLRRLGKLIPLYAIKNSLNDDAIVHWSAAIKLKEF